MDNPGRQVGAAWPGIGPIGVDGLVVGFGDTLTEAANRAALAFRAAVEDAAGAKDRNGSGDLRGVVETATSLTSTYLRLDPVVADHARVRAALGAMLAGRDWYQAPLPTGRRLWRVPAVFGTDLAPQLEDAAALAGLSVAEAVASICAEPLRVQTIGFAPGQPYLGELPPAWNIPRQTSLTPRVPEGALAVAIRQMVLFSVSTPTGWRHVAQTAVPLFRPDRSDPFLLRPGDAVLFHPVTREAFETIRREDPAGGAVA